MNKAPILAVDASEQWFLELPPSPLTERTRDHRWCRETFGSGGWHLTTRSRELPLAILAELVDAYAHVMVSLSAGFDGDRERLVIAHGARLNELARRRPGVLCVAILGEAETHLYHDLPSFATPEEALANYRRACFRYGAGKLRQEVVAPLLERAETVSLREYAGALLGFRLDEGLHVFTGPDKVWGVHAHLAWGADGVWLERSGWNCSVQVGIAFCRGAARQYGKRWCLEMSPWGGAHGAGRGPTTYDLTGKHVAGCSASVHWFTWLSTMLAGADLIKQQAQEVGFFRFPNPTKFGPANNDTARGFPLSDNQREEDPGRWGAPLSPLGEYAKCLAGLLREPGFDRGEPITSVVLVVPLAHGWDVDMFTRERCVWGGTVPYERGDQMLAAWLRLLLPGHEVAGRLMDPTFNPEYPFAAERDFMQAMYDGYDVRPLENGFFVPTPLGDSADVVTEEAPPEILAQYPVAILAGRAELTAANLPKLRTYVEDGGTLVVHSRGVAWSPEVEEFLGVRLKSVYLPGFHPSRLVTSGATCREGKYEYMLVTPTAAETIVTGEREQPLVTRHQVGRGAVIFSAAYHHLTLTGRELLNGVQATMAELIRPHLPIIIDGPPIQWQANRLDGGYIVGLFNWRPTPWKGKVAIPDFRPGNDYAEELIEKLRIPLVSSIRGAGFDADVGAYSIRLYRLR